MLIQNESIGHPLSRENCKVRSGLRFTVDGDVFELGGKVGDGAAGLVRKATRQKDGAKRAIKFLAPDPKYIDVGVFDDVANRFRREGERGAKLLHSHLLQVHSYCENERGSAFEGNEIINPFLEMEYVPGSTLESYIQRITLNKGRFKLTKEKLSIAIQIASALEYLKGYRLTHRDVKPANIFLTKNSHDKCPLAQLGDFGVMKWGDFHASIATGTLTVTSQKGLGTMKYMSPEQAITPKAVTIRSDIYSLGITLFELFTGQILASAHHVYEIMNARLSRDSTYGRFLSMGYKVDQGDEGIGEILLDMFLRGVDSRPIIDKVRGRLEFEYERRYNSDWESDIQY